MDRFDSGVTIGSYRIDRVLGEGGMAIVYRAIDTKLNRAVAIKFLSRALATDDDRRRFQREAHTASALNPPHIVTVHDVGEFDGRQYLVTELADGGTLTDWARAAPRSWRDVVELLVGIGDGLAAAHDAGILHRDVKPDNVLLTKTGYAKLADFGLARTGVAPDGATRAVSIDQTARGTVLGTVAYMSPEQATGADVDARSDIFSFGILLHELLAGRRPFAGPSAVDVMHAIVHDPAPALPKGLPAPLAAVVEKALEKTPADRYQSMHDLVTDLRRALRRADDPASTRGRPVLWAAAIATVVTAVAIAVWWSAARRSSATRIEYTPLTTFADSVVAPAISRDGRILAFIRGENTFVGPGEIFVKMLPDGEPSQLTHDRTDKMGPLVFSPDGSRLLYSVGNTEAWVVPVLGGQPTRLLTNAGALSWVSATQSGARRVLFSALTGEGIHMGVFTASETRADERRVYLPADVNGMAHRSTLSPDGRAVVVVEMDMLGWRPCRVVPFDGTSLGRTVGPPRSQCTDAAWSPRGDWIYLSANTGSGFHIWRQRYPDGEPEQVTSGATEEQGIAFDPDGQSFVTSIGDAQSTLWVHAGQTRQMTFEGFAYLPMLSDDGARLYYLQRSTADRRFVSGELWTIDLRTGVRERLLSDSLMEHFDVSRDGTRIVYVGVDAAGRSSVWQAPLDGRTPPRRLSSLEARRVLFGPDGAVVFLGGEAPTLYVYRVAQDGAPRKVLAPPANFLYDISPDGKWIAAWVGASVAFYPLDGGSPVVLCPTCGTAGEENRGVTPPLVRWSKDGRFLYFHVVATRQTYVLPLRPGHLLPDVPAGGFDDMRDAVIAFGATPLPDPRAFAGGDPESYVFPRVATHRNIYRVRVP